MTTITLQVPRHPVPNHIKEGFYNKGNEREWWDVRAYFFGGLYGTIDGEPISEIFISFYGSLRGQKMDYEGFLHCALVSLFVVDDQGHNTGLSTDIMGLKRLRGGTIVALRDIHDGRLQLDEGSSSLAKMQQEFAVLFKAVSEAFPRSKRSAWVNLLLQDIDAAIPLLEKGVHP